MPDPIGEWEEDAPEDSIVETPDAYKAPPGYYMLFVLKDKTLSTSGDWKIPSVAKFVKLSNQL